ncbi:MAG: hypothetical protein WCD12_11970 [Candidatus Binatus sp.]|jgi:hypothetical protein|uniref:hypothetical protein n=1 Tax=Candidatus Binatus sp. TaxID=2811406 RepID=UPI003C790966
MALMMRASRKISRQIVAAASALFFSALTPVAHAQMTPACSASESSGEYCVGASRREITPTSPVYLGGYGFGPVRRSTGVMSPIYARAIAISRGDKTVVFCAIDTQGHFLAYQGDDAPYGAADIRRRVSKDTGIPASAIIIASTHDHSGPDDIGVWGGLPPAYLNFVADQAVAAIESSVRGERSASLYSGEINTAPSHLLRSLLPGYPIDTKLRVIFARGSDGAPFATLINFSAHVTALGKDNAQISPDWPGAALEAIAKANPGSTALVMVASVGRTLPDLKAIGARGPSAAQTYGAAVAKLALVAEALAVKVDGPIATAETILEEPAENSVLVSLMTTGKVGVDRVMRSNREPYMTADKSKVRTVVGAIRIGNLFFAAMPGESFPETQMALEARVAADGHYLFSLADDQLGYDPPPYEVVMVEFVSPLDEGLFIINSRFGTDVTRTLLAQARALDFTVSDTSYTGDEAREARGLVDSIDGTIGMVEEPIARRLIPLMLWLGYDRFH